MYEGSLYISQRTSGYQHLSHILHVLSRSQVLRRPASDNEDHDISSELLEYVQYLLEKERGKQGSVHVSMDPFYGNAKYVFKDLSPISKDNSGDGSCLYQLRGIKEVNNEDKDDFFPSSSPGSSSRVKIISEDSPEHNNSERWQPEYLNHRYQLSELPMFAQIIIEQDENLQCQECRRFYELHGFSLLFLR